MKKYYLRLTTFFDIVVEAQDEAEATLKAVQEATRQSLYDTDWEVDDIYEEPIEDDRDAQTNE